MKKEEKRREKTEPLTVADLGGEAREGFQTDHLGARLARYGKAKADALQFRDFLLSAGELKLADALGSCGNYAVFRDYFTVGQSRLSRFCTCKKHLVCPLCAIRRGAKALRVYLARVEHLLAQDADLRPYMVTFTVKNGPDLAERFHHLHYALRAYHKRRKGKGQTGEVRKASAAVWSYEFTNQGKGWHPHVHAVWLCRVRPDKHALADEWKALTGDSFIVDVRLIGDDDYVGGFCEVFKYAMKFSGLANEHRLSAFYTLKGKRLQDSFGDLRGLDVEPGDSDELLEDLPYIERLYRYVTGKGYVQVEQIHHAPADAAGDLAQEYGWSPEKLAAFREYLKEQKAA